MEDAGKMCWINVLDFRSLYISVSLDAHVRTYVRTLTWESSFSK